MVVLEMGSHLTGLTMRIRGQTSAWIQFALATPVVVWAGWPFFERGARSLVTRSLNMFTPIAMGVGLQRGHYPGSAGLSTGVPQDGRLAAIFAIADPIKPTTAEAVRALQAEGVRLVMMTSDNSTTALAVARRLGIDDVEAEVLPQDKAAVVEKRRREGHRVAMAGDGVNDAPALAAADVCVAMGAGADVAIETAGVTLLRGDLQGLVKARRLSRARDAPYPGEPDLRRRLQRRRRFLSGVWPAAFAADRGGDHGALVGQRHWQRPAAAAGVTLPRTADKPFAGSPGEGQG